MRFALLLLLVGCAGNQSAFPVAPIANPYLAPPPGIIDAPITVGQPGYAGSPENMPRSHGRVLPQTPETRKEAGIWATRDTELEKISITVAGVTWDVIVVNKDDSSALVALACEQTVNDVLRDHPAIRDAVAELSAEERRCFAAVTYQDCTNFRLREHRRSMRKVERDGHPAGAEMEAFEYGLTVAHGFADFTTAQACINGAWSGKTSSAAALWSLAAFPHSKEQMQ